MKTYKICIENNNYADGFQELEITADIISSDWIKDFMVFFKGSERTKNIVFIVSSKKLIYVQLEE